MNFSNRFRVIWWAGLFAVFTGAGIFRVMHQSNGGNWPSSIGSPDAVLALLWIGLAAAPIYSDVSFFGVSLRQEVSELRSEIRNLAVTLRTEMQLTASFASQLNQSVVIHPPPSDRDLPSAKKMADKAIEANLQRAKPGAKTRDDVAATAPRSEDLGFEELGLLAQTRQDLERELRRIWIRTYGRSSPSRMVPLLTISSDLVRDGSLASDLAGALRDVYSICSAGLHGESISDSQLAFVREIAPRLLEALRSVD